MRICSDGTQNQLKALLSLAIYLNIYIYIHITTLGLVVRYSAEMGMSFIVSFCYEFCLISV